MYKQMGVSLNIFIYDAEGNLKWQTNTIGFLLAKLVKSL